MRVLGLTLALSVVLQVGTYAQQVNTVNDGSVINAGTYLNTPNGKTIFKNSTGTGIHLQSGQNIRGAEYFNGSLTGNGGNIHIDAPNQVVRLDGNIDVRGFLPKGIIGNAGSGGNVTVNAGYLYQTGNIYASGLNGGIVQFNTGCLTMGATSRIEATGQNYIGGEFASDISGTGGRVGINSTGDVTISKGAFITTNGSPNPLRFDEYGNSIVIVGRGVNVDGILYARQGQGEIRISATGPDRDLNISNGAVIRSAGGTVTLNSQRDINQNGLVLNNGSAFFNPSSDNSPWSPGTQGSAGGTISLTAANSVSNTARIQADGHGSNGGVPQSMGAGFRGGKGGVITISAPSISNTGVIRAMAGNATLFNNQEPGTLGAGGDGGTVNFFGANPTGEGIVATYGGQGSTVGKLGTITAPNPAAVTNKLYGIWQKNQ
jgi:hypothetical protein